MHENAEESDRNDEKAMTFCEVAVQEVQLLFGKPMIANIVVDFATKGVFRE